jgi:hypothetical protein
MVEGPLGIILTASTPKMRFMACKGTLAMQEITIVSCGKDSSRSSGKDWGGMVMNMMLQSRHISSFLARQWCSPQSTIFCRDLLLLPEGEPQPI